MGLDMYVYTVEKHLIGDAQVDLNDKLFKNGKAAPGVNTDFHYWRKFNAVHGWMRRLYHQKGGVSIDFNCNTVRLMPGDLDDLEREATSLQPEPGFFFGDAHPITPDEVQEVRAFVNKAREALAAGLAVVYDSWW